MSPLAAFSGIQDGVGRWVSDFRSPGENRLDMDTTPDTLIPAVAALSALGWGYLSAITGFDTGPGGHIEVLYHFYRGPAVATFRVNLPRENPTVPSIGQVVPPAVLYERELAETMGVRLAGLPDNKRQFLSDDWPQGVYPLRKDFTLESARATNEAAPVVGSDEAPGTFIIPIGPQHPALKEPGHFELAVDGEIVTHANIRLGYVHRGIEKGAEDRSWVHNIYLMERICGICSHIHATAYVLGVEHWRGRPSRRAPRSSARCSVKWNGSTATSCGSAWRRTRRGSRRFSCTAGVTVKPSWTCWKSSRATA